MFEFPGFDEKIISNMEIRMLLQDGETEYSIKSSRLNNGPI